MDYESINVVCPFFKKEQSHCISCEGVFKLSNTTTRFPTGARKEAIKKRYCESDYRACRLYNALESKYDEEGALIDDADD